MPNEMNEPARIRCESLFTSFSLTYSPAIKVYIHIANGRVNKCLRKTRQVGRSRRNARRPPFISANMRIQRFAFAWGKMNHNSWKYKKKKKFYDLSNALTHSLRDYEKKKPHKIDMRMKKTNHSVISSKFSNDKIYRFFKHVRILILSAGPHEIIEEFYQFSSPMIRVSKNILQLAFSFKFQCSRADVCAWMFFFHGNPDD